MSDASRDQERWLPVPRFERLYEVSDLGRLRRVGGLPKSLKPGYGGYVGVILHRCGRRHKSRMHVLVLETFVCPRPPGMHSLHRNGNPSDNRLANLRWGTPSENRYDTVRHGRHPARLRSHCPRGHILEMPNLRRSSFKNGFRNCRACSSTQDAQRYALSRGRSFDFDAHLDRTYARIMQGA